MSVRILQAIMDFGTMAIVALALLNAINREYDKAAFQMAVACFARLSRA